MQCRKQTWVLATRLDEVPNHNQISIKWRNRGNLVGKTLLQKEIAKKSSEGLKKPPTRGMS